VEGLVSFTTESILSVVFELLTGFANERLSLIFSSSVSRLSSVYVSLKEN